MQIVLNDISISTDPCDHVVIREVMSTFLSTYSQLRNDYNNLLTDVIATQDINYLEIAPGYPIAKWRNAEVDRDIKRRFLGLCDHIKICAPSEDDIICISQDKKYGQGLQLAAEVDAPVISFTFSECWQQDYISCSIYLCANDESYDENIRNFSTKQSICVHHDWLKEQANRDLANITTPEQFLSRIDSQFPSLLFLDTAIAQIKHSLPLKAIPIVVEKLHQLETYFSCWDGGVFQRDAFPARFIAPESDKTLEAYKKEHTYSFNGRSLLVSYHVRYTGADYPGRIYFYPDHETKKCIICSLVTKLPTVKEPKFRR